MKKSRLWGAAHTGVLFFVCSVCVLLTPLAHADTVNVSASVWGTAQDAGRDGSFESISDPNNILLKRIFGGQNVIERGVWEFDLSELPTGTILGIDLQLSVVSTTLERAAFDVYGYAGNGAIEAADAATGSLLAADLNGNIASQAGPVIFDVTNFILDPAVQAAGFAGFNARYSDETTVVAASNKQFQTPSASTGNTATPWLVVQFAPVPVPAAVWLFCSGLLGLIGISRRRKVA